MFKFYGCEFSAAGANKKDKVYGLTLNSTEDVLIEDCKFNGTGYSALLNKNTGNVVVKNCEFECDNIYNPIEGGQTAVQGVLTVEDCEFNGIPGNNFINFYKVAEDSIHNVKNCKFYGSANNNIIRLSNTNNAHATFNFENIKFEFIGGTPDEYTGFILCQDYTNRNGQKQEFDRYTLNLNNIECPENIQTVYVYEDGIGIIQNNYPTTFKDGEQIIWTNTASTNEEEL